MEINNDANCFITLKDHKENFANNPTCRLINPAKNELGRISKAILDKINHNLCKKLKVNQWKNTQNVIEWFKNIPDKHLYKFIMFDIKDFYPSITQELLNKAIKFAEEHITISQDDKKIIDHARKSLLFNNKEAWMKRKGGLFDVTMGAFDGAEVCELIGILLLYIIAQYYLKKDFGLYRDDGLGVVKNKSGPEAEKIKKSIQKLFKDNGLEIVIKCNMKIVDYLDVTFNLNDGTYKPFTKPNNEITYVHKESNHPPNILRQIPISIELRLSALSSNEKIFNESITPYKEALQKSGYAHNFSYNPPNNNNENKTNRNRKRNIIWFNPPYSSNVINKVGKFFLNLLSKHFPPRSKLYKLFNRNNVKVSYSCMPNMKSIINAHNRQILYTEDQSTEKKQCNCMNKNNCPLSQKCLTQEMVYQANLVSNIDNEHEKIYKGLCETTFKIRYGNHKKTFNYEKYKNDTELASEFWRIKNLNGSSTIKWSLLGKYKSYDPNTKRCNLCLAEKYEILTHKGDNLLNKRSEIISTCRHKRKYLLGSCKQS